MPKDFKILEVTRWEEIHAVMNQNKGTYAVIDFWAPWCTPCLQLSPHFYEMATTFAEKPYVFSKVNVEDAEEFTNKFSVVSLPTILVIDAKGKEVKRVVGKRLDAIREMIEKLPPAETNPVIGLLSKTPSPTPSIFDNPYLI